MKPFLIGESNPYGADPRFALYPEPRGCAGWRLCHLVLHVQPHRYRHDFERRNVLVGKWSAPRARDAAARLAAEIGDAKVVLLGAKVCAAFSLAFEPFTVVLGRVAILPHPSGLSRAWNEPGAFERARQVLRDAGVLPQAEALSVGGKS